LQFCNVGESLIYSGFEGVKKRSMYPSSDGVLASFSVQIYNVGESLINSGFEGVKKRFMYPSSDGCRFLFPCRFAIWSKAS
jgi:hypothetical protein